MENLYFLKHHYKLSKEKTPDFRPVGKLLSV